MKIKGLLVNSIESYITNSTEKSNLVKFIKRERFNDITFYATSSVIPEYTSELGALVLQIQALSNVRKISFTIGSTGDANRVRTFLDANPTITSTTGIWIEYEWWNNEPRDFSSVSTLVSTIQTTFPGLEIGCYIGNITQEEIVSLSNMVDKIFLHSYVSNINNVYTYTKTRLSYLETASVKRVPIIILLSAEPDFSGPYITSNSMKVLEKQYITRFNADRPALSSRSSKTWRDKLALEGFYYYGWTYLKLALGL